MDEGVKQNCHSRAEALINCQGGWGVWQASLEKGAPRCQRGPAPGTSCWGEYSRSDYSSAQAANGPDNSLGSYSSRKHSFLRFREICSQAPLGSPEPSAAVVSDSSSAGRNAHQQTQHPLHPPSVHEIFLFPGCCKLHFDGNFLDILKSLCFFFPPHVGNFRQTKLKIMFQHELSPSSLKIKTKDFVTWKKPLPFIL